MEDIDNISEKILDLQASRLKDEIITIYKESMQKLKCNRELRRMLKVARELLKH